MTFKKTTKFNTILGLIIILISEACAYAQNTLDLNFKFEADNKYGMEFHIPKGYYGINIAHCYNPHEDFLQSSLNHSITHEKRNIIIAFALLSIVPDNTPRGVRLRQVLGNPYRINSEALTNEVDGTLSNVAYLNTLELKKVNADRGVVFNMKIDNKYMGKYEKCKKIELYKDNVGRAEILFFYNKGNDTLVDAEIKKTWGMLKFK